MQLVAVGILRGHFTGSTGASAGGGGKGPRRVATAPHQAGLGDEGAFRGYGTGVGQDTSLSTVMPLVSLCPDPVHLLTTAPVPSLPYLWLPGALARVAVPLGWTVWPCGCCAPGRPSPSLIQTSAPEVSTPLGFSLCHLELVCCLMSTCVPGARPPEHPGLCVLRALMGRPPSCVVAAPWDSVLVLGGPLSTTVGQNHHHHRCGFPGNTQGPSSPCGHQRSRRVPPAVPGASSCGVGLWF